MRKPDEDSAVQIVARLRTGECYARAIFIPSNEIDAQRIRDAKRKLRQDLSSVIARAKKVVSNEFRQNICESFTQEYDVVVMAIVIRDTEL